ncbi:hypothetical protein HF675_13580 [Serratia sp. JUb9]|uniref:hypothetical protein n=1 Tax=Serratia sp. JUb9 TaxID=2724469 RepID=UPI00164DB083|nr:hypothetical protein [Serratia sp. JUb9]QNK30680.1 hypothetical protein HF675_13580 [Serratia sp. JUb9]QPT15450.1 hypothetical protein I6G37_11090 [Serratia rubidaea]
MIGFEAAAFINPDLDKVQNTFSEVSHSVERPLDDFDRSHSKSISKKQVLLAVKKTDAIIDEVHARVADGIEMAKALRYGNEEDLQRMELREDSEAMMSSLVSQLTIGNNRLAYTFFKAESNPAWLPHIRHLRYMKTRAMKAFGEYKKISEELHALVALHLTPPDEAFNLDMVELKKSINSETIEHPDWVKNGDDFVDWIQSLKRDA